MAERLSQDQIDNLLQSFANADSDDPAEQSPEKKPEKKYKLHDFQNPKIFSKEQIRTVSIIYDNYAKHLSSFMSGVLRTECTISINTVEEQRYFEYSNALPESIMMGVLDVKPIEGNMLIEIKKDTCYLILDRLLGGINDEPFTQTDFSDIEIKLLENMFYKKIIRYLKDSWSNVAEIDPVFSRIETNARLTQIMPLDEVVIIVLLNVKIRDYEGSMSVCIPCINLESLLGDANNYILLNRKKNVDSEKNKKNIFENLKNSNINIRGILGKTTLSLQDLLYLQVGDVMSLDKSIDSPVVLRIGAMDWFTGEIGVKKNKMAIKIKNLF